MLITRRRVRIDKESPMTRLETLIRSVPVLPLMAVAALCAASPALANEERVKNPKPADSLLHPGDHEAPQAAREPAATTTQPVSPQGEGAAAVEPSKPSAPKAGARKKTASSPVDRKPVPSTADTAKPKGASGSPTQTVTTPDAEKTVAPERKK
jgi:hypothetical protein